MTAKRGPPRQISTHHARGRQQRLLRIIAGQWRGKKFRFPELDLRPTPDRVRETLFNWLQDRVEGAHCLDLYAGSGALGLEALSRGAASVIMVEKNPAALRALRDNAQKLGATGLTVVRGDALEFARGARSRFDVAFVDPPYRLGMQVAALDLLRGLLAAGGRVYVEGDAAFEPPRGWAVFRRARAGNVHFHLLVREADDQGGVSGNI